MRFIILGYHVLSPTTIQKLTAASRNSAGAGLIIHPQHLLAATHPNGGKLLYIVIQVF